MKTIAALLLCPVLALAAEPVRILPLGDSVTHGWYSGVTGEMDSYRKVLKNLLGDAGYTTDFVGTLTDGNFADNQHEGHDGCFADHPTSTNKLAGHVAGWMLGNGADIVLLHIGTNDLNGNDTNTHNEVSAVLDEIYGANSNATVVLALIVNVQDGHPELAANISTYNSNLNAMAQARIGNGDNLIVVDMEHGAGIDYASVDMADRLHPSPQGYNKMATNWFPAVEQAIFRQQGAQLAGISSTNNQITLGLDNLVSNWPVQVEWTPGLDPPQWTNHTALLPTTVTTNLIFPASETSAFFRAVAP